MKAYDDYGGLYAKHFETLVTGEIKQITINEPIKIVIFTAHPSNVKGQSLHVILSIKYN